MCGLEFKEQELSLAPGWNRAFVDLSRTPTCNIELTGEDGNPLGLELTDWDGITVTSKATGAPVKVVPGHMRRKGVGTWSRCRLEIPADGVVVIHGLSSVGFTEDTTELTLKEGERYELRVK